MTISFKTSKEYADQLILGLAYSGVTVSAEKEADRMIRQGSVIITADFPAPPISEDDVDDLQSQLQA